ncbi:uncharacterized protein LOC110726791 [Chenopodium quinoa]|uniref:uncharacterized protein LOC110726791 n=1 Tax=Chenopodium quinoa TaxID=63459 RepID=UPI000B7785C8|nr:uncharacterized protein LOC110726791 [Chenopodium quinoa]
MRKDWRLWKNLKQSETGIGWDPKSGKIDATNEWWQRKIKENSDFQRFRLRGVNLELEQKWEQLFGDSYATGENVYVPSIDPIEDLTIQNENLEEENIDNDGGDNYFPSDQYAQDLLNDEGNFFQHFIEQARNDANLGSSGSRSSQVTSEAVNNDTRPSNKIQKHLPLKSNSGQVKRTRRQSAGSAMISKGIIEMTECVKRISQSSTSNVSTISTAMNTICRMVENEYLEKHSEFWCFATTVIGDATKREIFLSMEDDDSRAKWLAYLYIKGLLLIWILMRKECANFGLQLHLQYI